MEFDKLLIKLATAFNENKIPYMVIGGQAAIFHGEFRTTKDIDLTLGVDISELDRITNCLNEIGLIILVKDPKDFVLHSWVLPLKDMSSGIRVDISFSFSPYERQAIDNAINYKLENTNIRYCQPEDLIVHKIFAGREIDLIDVRKVLLKNKNVNTKYIIKWLKMFEKTTDEKYINRFKEVLDSIK